MTFHTSESPAAEESLASGLSWSAIFGGAFIAVALSLILLALGTGLGLSSVSPWSNSGISATSFGLATAVWLIVIQVIAYGIGGYIAGRLRCRWNGVHTDEIYFRDTAHGLAVWAVGALLFVGLLSGAAATIASGGAQVAAGAVSGATGAATAATATSAANPSSGSSAADPTAYFVDALFRYERPATDATDPAVRVEVGRILVNSFASGDISPADKSYVAQLVAARTGMTPDLAAKRVDDVVGQAKAAAAKADQAARQAADAARKAASYFALWSFLALLAGAFSASLAATVGGSARDTSVAR